MALHVNKQQEISTEIAREVMLPIIQEWFDLSHTNHVLQNMDVQSFTSGAALVKIELGLLASAEQMEALSEALRAAGTDLA